MTRTGDFVYLKTRGYLEVDDTSKKVQSFVCINTLVTDDEGRQLVREMKRKFSVIVEQEELPDESDEPAVENPMQIERAVLNLLTNLHSEDDEPVERAALPSIPSQDSDASGNSQLAIIAPSSKEVKSAIVKSMNVIAIASKKMSNGSNSPLRDSASSPKLKNHSSSSPGNITSATAMQRPSVLQKAQSPASESRVPPLHGSDHGFIQPFSPAGSSSSSSSSSGSVFSPASHFQRNSRSPFGGSIPPTSPPAIAAAPSPSGSRLVDNTANSHARSTSVLKRTYSNSSISTTDDTTVGHTADYLVHKRSKASPPGLDVCMNRLANPATGEYAELIFSPLTFGMKNVFAFRSHYNVARCDARGRSVLDDDRKRDGYHTGAGQRLRGPAQLAATVG